MDTKIGQGQRDYCFGAIHSREVIPPIRRREVLQFGGAHGRTVARMMADFQAASAARRGEEWIKEQKGREDETQPSPLS